MRVLHVIQLEPGPSGWLGGRGAWRWEDDAPAAACAALVAEAGSMQHAVLALGGPGTVAWSPLTGVRVNRLWSPMGSAVLAVFGLRARIRRTDPGLVVAWGAGAAKITGIACAHLAPWSFVDFAAGTVAMFPMGGTPSVVALDAESAVPFPAGLDRAHARGRLGVSDGERLIGLLTRSPGAGAALAYVLGILNVAGIPAVGVLDPRTPGVTRALRHARAGAYARRIILSPVPITHLWEACDAGLCVAPEAGAAPFAARLVTAAARARGLPVVTGPLEPGEEPPGDGRVVAASGSRADLGRAVASVVSGGRPRTMSVRVADTLARQVLGVWRGAGVVA